DRIRTRSRPPPRHASGASRASIDRPARAGAAGRESWRDHGESAALFGRRFRWIVFFVFLPVVLVFAALLGGKDFELLGPILLLLDGKRAREWTQVFQR